MESTRTVPSAAMWRLEFPPPTTAAIDVAIAVLPRFESAIAGRQMAANYRMFDGAAVRLELPDLIATNCRRNWWRDLADLPRFKSTVAGRQITADCRMSMVRPRHQFPKLIAANSRCN